VDAGLHDILAGIADLTAERVAANLADKLEASHQIPSAEKQPDFLNEQEIARISSISVRTLQGWRAKGHGPRFVRAHRKVLYPRLDVAQVGATQSVRGR
jgi:hypothetical protein